MLEIHNFCTSPVSSGKFQLAVSSELAKGDYLHLIVPLEQCYDDVLA
jgi:hypothetical protein